MVSHRFFAGLVAASSALLPVYGGLPAHGQPQPPPYDAANAPEAVAAVFGKGWLPFTSGVGRFRAWFPGEPRETLDQTAHGMLKGRYRSSDKEREILFSVGFHMLSEQTRKGLATEEKGLEFAQKVFAGNGKLLSSRHADLAGHKCVHVELQAPNGLVVCARLLIHDGVLYHCVAAATPEILKRHARVIDAYFNSFEPSAEPFRASAAEVPEPLRRLWTAVLEFRGRCVKQGTEGWQAFASPAVQNRLKLLDEQLWIEADSDTGWSYFFSGALFNMGHPSAKTPIVGFYHPWSDVWILTQWHIEPEPKITDVEVLLGDWFRQRGQPPFDVCPDWLCRKGFWSEQLLRATVENVREFDRLMYGKETWWKALKLADQKTLLDEANYPIAALRLRTALLRSDELTVGDKEEPVLEQLVAAGKGFLRSGLAGELEPVLRGASLTNSGTVEVLRAMPAATFASMAPAYWLADKRHAAAFLVPEMNPDFCLVLTFSRQPDSLKLERVDMLHFPTAYELVETKAVQLKRDE
ncbi:MAG: hypothetical protein RBS80_22320 [Thermoguttaceae bacterium]|jgi:hypothetical protein|nr:hypothetical protein [Thermoguttaceae bacterium]